MLKLLPMPRLPLMLLVPKLPLIRLLLMLRLPLMPKLPLIRLLQMPRLPQMLRLLQMLLRLLLMLPHKLVQAPLIQLQSKPLPQTPPLQLLPLTHQPQQTPPPLIQAQHPSPSLCNHRSPGTVPTDAASTTLAWSRARGTAIPPSAVPSLLGASASGEASDLLSVSYLVYQQRT